MSHNKVRDLIVDTGAFLRNAALQDFGTNIYTCEEVLAEVKSKWAKDQLQVLPYEIKIKQPEEEDIQFVTKFARKTGDFSSLSSTDLKVIALAVRLEREKNGNIDHLKSTPSSTKIISNVPENQGKGSKSNNDYGFNFKNKLKNKVDDKMQDNLKDKVDDENSKDDAQVESDKDEEEEDQMNNNRGEEDEEYYSNGTEDDEYNSCEESLNGDEENLEDNGNDGDDENLDDDEENVDDEDDDFNDYYTNLIIKRKDDLNKQETIKEADNEDDGDWITPSNINLVKQQFGNLKIDEKARKTKLDTACITGDFSMQNVLMQIGIKVLSVQKGLLIKQARQFVLRCFACYTITTNTGLMFCPSCGNLKTLKKVSVSVDENGQKRIHLNPKRPITTRDVKLRIPRPRKGKYALNPILVADQHVPKFRQAKFAIQERKQVQESILNDVGYLVRDNPFSINDVYSRSSNYKTGSRAAAINNMVFNEGRKYATKKKRKRRN